MREHRIFKLGNAEYSRIDPALLPIHHRFNITIHQILMIMADAYRNGATRRTSVSPILREACACERISANAPTLLRFKSL